MVFCTYDMCDIYLFVTHIIHSHAEKRCPNIYMYLRKRMRIPAMEYGCPHSYRTPIYLLVNDQLPPPFKIHHYASIWWLHNLDMLLYSLREFLVHDACLKDSPDRIQLKVETALSVFRGSTSTVLCVSWSSFLLLIVNSVFSSPFEMSSIQWKIITGRFC